MNTFSEWINRELKLKEEEDMAKKKEKEVPIITDAQLTLVNPYVQKKKRELK